MPDPVLLLQLAALVPGPGGAVASGPGSLTLLIVYVALAIGVSFLCSILEAVLLSITPAYVGALSETNPPLAEQLKSLKADVDRPLSAILTLNTIAHTVGATGAGAQAAALWGGQNIWIFTTVGVFSAVLTLGILILSEIIPKTLGAVYWRGLAGFVGRALPVLIWITLPLVWLSQGITKLIARGKKEGAVSREEIAAMAEIGREEGVFDESETRILSSLLRFNALTAKDVMTPRTVIKAYPHDTPIQTLSDDSQPFSRLPLYEDTVDHIIGYVLRDDVLAAAANGDGDKPAHTLAREVLTIPDSLPLPKVFDRLLDRREHIALVVGEYGGTAGLVTMEDVIETLLGLEIVDESDHDHDMQAAARQRWAERAERLGLHPEFASPIHDDAAAAVQYGLTGGQPPPEG